jgi:hypothetical protein
MTFSFPTNRQTHSVGTGALAFVRIFSLGLVLSLSVASTFAQGLATQPVQPTGSTKQTVAASSGPAWKELTVAQQLSLKPLAGTWATLGEGQKRKWIAIAANYNSLQPAEQVKLHSRMTEWVSLTQQQRTQARLNFAETKQLTPDQKTATWQAYQALSAEEKAKLAVAAKPKPVGAAAAIKPVAPEKLAPVPVTRKTVVDAPKPPSAKPFVNPNTLLPQSPPAGPAAAVKN